MNYFTGGFYGNFSHYKHIKEQFAKNEDDTLWILGNIFDGNDEHPEDCLRIYEDIKETKNIKFIIGEHEYYHIMRFINKGNRKQHKIWVNYLNSLSPDSGEELTNLFFRIGDDEESSILRSMVNTYGISDIIKIGGIYFYITYGFPVVRHEDMSLGDWQMNTMRNLKCDPNFIPAIKTDEELNEHFDSKVLKEYNTILICMDKSHNDTITYEDHIFRLNEDRYDGTQVLAIDAGGFNIYDVKYKKCRF